MAAVGADRHRAEYGAEQGHLRPTSGGVEGFLSARNFRLELMLEMLQGSRIIKMLGYESGIFDAIKGRREKELGKLAKILRLQVAVATLINATPPIMGVATFVAMSWLLGEAHRRGHGLHYLDITREPALRARCRRPPRRPSSLPAT